MADTGGALSAPKKPQAPILAARVCSTVVPGPIATWSLPTVGRSPGSTLVWRLASSGRPLPLWKENTSRILSPSSHEL